MRLGLKQRFTRSVCNNRKRLCDELTGNRRPQNSNYKIGGITGIKYQLGQKAGVVAC